MKPCDPHNSKSGGQYTEKGTGSTVLVHAYGKDDSDVSKSPATERGLGGFGGGDSDLSHSLSGATAKQGAD